MSRILEAWRQDLARASRSLLRAPAFSALAVLTLALAIGANTAVFSVVDAVLIGALDFPESDRLVSIRGTAPGTDLPEEFGVGTEFYVQYREQATTLADLGLYQTGQTTVSAGEHLERLFVSTASPSLFSTLRVEPQIGRLPTERDVESTVSVLSHWLWTEWFAADPAVLNTSVSVSGEVTTVIGVMPADFRFPEERTSLWVHDLPSEPIQPGGFGLNLVGRLAPGATHETLAAELATLARRLPDRFGGTARYQSIIDQHRPVVRSLQEELVGDFEAPLWILSGTVALVLLIGCANVANLLIVRAESRKQDLAVRRALGAGRGGVVRVLMSEALLLSAAGAVGGVALAWVGVPLLVRAAPEGIPNLATAGIDPSTLLFTAGVAVVAALVAGLLPALRSSRVGLAAAMGSARRTGGGPDHLTRDALVVVQTAAALVLLVGSGLLVRSFRALNDVDPGYVTEDIFSFQMAPDAAAMGLVDGPTFAQFHYDFMDRLRQLPGVESVGLVNTLPLDEGAGNVRVELRGDDGGTGEIDVPIRNTWAGGDYFRTMGIEILMGEDFVQDPNPREDVRALVSRSAADRMWPGENPIGKQLRPSGAGDFPWITVGGVVEDVLLDDFRQTEPDPMLYLPIVGPTARSWTIGTPAYVVRTSRAETIAPEIRELIAEVAPGAPMYRVFTMRELAARSMAELSFTMLTLGVAAVLALILGAVGIYGTLSYVVTQRTREIGIRMALGAEAARVRRMVVAQGGTVVLVGVVTGVVAAVSLARVLESLLFGVPPLDPATFVTTSALMLGVAVVAAYQPARRASAVDPVRALREEQVS